MKKVVAVTGSKISAAHTIMAAEALEATADMMGYDIRVERRGPSGTSDPLTEGEIRNADVVILATDQPDEQSRFQGQDGPPRHSRRGDPPHGAASPRRRRRQGTEPGGGTAATPARSAGACASAASGVSTGASIAGRACVR